MPEQLGVSYQDVSWRSVAGQPFGVGAGYSGMIFGSLTNIVDMEGPVAVSGDVGSYRGMSVGFGRMGARTLPYSPTAVRFLAGGKVNIAGALTVTGNVLTSGDTFEVGTGSTYLVGKSGEAGQREELARLYAANGSPYWEPAAHADDYYIISSYDTPRRIPAERVGADVQGFFAAARESMACWQNVFSRMTANGTVEPLAYGYALRGGDARQNVFDLTWPAEGSLTGNLTLDVPADAVTIVRVFSGDTVTISTPVWGAEALRRRTLFVFMNATSIRLVFPSVFYGSVFAPQAAWYALTTGGNVNGNVALASLWVQEGSGFELHWFPFEGGVLGGEACASGDTALECPACPACPVCPACPTPECPVSPTPECPACPTCPTCPTCPAQECPACPTPECPACPAQECPACPACPTPECPVCPTCPTCPAQECPACPTQECPACPTQECPTCPAQECPTCPTCPTQECPACPTQECPACPAQECPECATCPTLPDCRIATGLITGCLMPNGQCTWRLRLVNRNTRETLSVWQGCGLGCFSFEANADGHYLLAAESCCHYELRLNNVGVRSLSLRG